MDADWISGCMNTFRSGQIYLWVLAEYPRRKVLAWLSGYKEPVYVQLIKGRGGWGHSMRNSVILQLLFGVWGSFAFCVIFLPPDWSDFPTGGDIGLTKRW